ncbi:MAG: winged helix DNA-binding domain-containing protein [Anaerolinea sp.]|nr:winged helix DNA-binding domain-containing protein [Anaerolinea sp.]
METKQVVMINNEIAQRRLFNQCISKSAFNTPEKVMEWLVAVQAQDYFGAKWALGLRIQNAIDNDIEQAFTKGSILRTHLLRPTWHFVSPFDIRWLLELTAPHVRAANAYMYRKHGLDCDVFRQSNGVLVKALQQGNQLTRDELGVALNEAGIATDDGNRLAYLMMNAELDGLICSGPRRGNQFTYVLLEERAPQARTLKRDEALAELSMRFFISRGPATVQDYAKWSGLTISEARFGLESVKSNLQNEVVGDQSYWSSKEIVQNVISPTAYLLSAYDEYISSYKNHNAVCENEFQVRLSSQGNGLNNIMVIDGQIIGSWRRNLKKKSMVLEMNPFIQLTKEENQAVIGAAQSYADFFQLSAEIVQSNLHHQQGIESRL